MKVSENKSSLVANWSVVVFSFIILSCIKQDPQTPAQSDAYQKLVERTQKIVFKKPGDFLAQSYCYFVFQAIIDPVEVPPKLFSRYVKGGSLSASHLESYERWLKRENGQLCQEVIGSSFERLSLQGEKKYAVLLNQKAIERDGEKLELIYHHELLHVAYAHFKNNRKKIQKLWQELTPQQQLRFKQKHKGYNFQNENVLWREYFSYTYQNRPHEGIQMLVR